jgi:hypothetical protein
MNNNDAGEMYEKDCVSAAVFKAEELETVLDTRSPCDDFEPIAESDVQEWLDAAENPILIVCDRDKKPAFEPITVTWTEPDVGDPRCIKDEIVRKGNMANPRESNEVCKSEETRKRILTKPPWDILHLTDDSDVHREVRQEVLPVETLREGF